MPAFDISHQQSSSLGSTNSFTSGGGQTVGGLTFNAKPPGFFDDPVKVGAVAVAALAVVYILKKKRR